MFLNNSVISRLLATVSRFLVFLVVVFLWPFSYVDCNKHHCILVCGWHFACLVHIFRILMLCCWDINFEHWPKGCQRPYHFFHVCLLPVWDLLLFQYTLPSGTTVNARVPPKVQFLSSYNINPFTQMPNLAKSHPFSVPYFEPLWLHIWASQRLEKWLKWSRTFVPFTLPMLSSAFISWYLQLNVLEYLKTLVSDHLIFRWAKEYLS